ncbi:MAG: hypothetical protein GSR84_00425 [Desulfurococcales archaeon]|nr:hypothetical protein [Desulfurococcales archaeon]
MPQEPREEEGKARNDYTSSIHPTLLLVSSTLARLGLKTFIIDARSLIVHGVDLGRETRDWIIIIDKPFTMELRDTITRELRSRGFKVQWRKWGFLVEDGIHIDINYAPLILDSEFIERSREVAENILLPSMEDIIILKLMSGERKDIDDIKKILAQAWHRIDKDYLYRRAQQAGLERELRKVLRRAGLR